MTTLALLPEVWGLVLSHLRQPTPRPTGKNQPSSIRQPDLAVCMRVNKLFYELTGPLLYSTIVSDHLPSLTRNLNTPAASSNIKCKRHLLSTCKHLYLEYCPKNEPTYSSLLFHGEWVFLLLEPSEAERMAFARAEAVGIWKAAEALTSVMTRLRTLSTGAILGGQFEWWWPICQKWGGTEVEQDAEEARIAITGLAVHRTPAAIMCQRVKVGPLVYATQIRHDSYPTKVVREGDGKGTGKGTGKGKESEVPVHCMHMEGVRIRPGNIPAVRGGRARWYGVDSGVLEGPVSTMAVNRIVNLIGQHVDWRQRHGDLAVARTQAIKQADFQVDIYLPSVFFRPSMTDWFDQSLERKLKKVVEAYGTTMATVREDVWRIKPLDEAPSCEACGWCVDDI